MTNAGTTSSKNSQTISVRIEFGMMGLLNSKSFFFLEKKNVNSLNDDFVCFPIKVN